MAIPRKSLAHVAASAVLASLVLLPIASKNVGAQSPAVEIPELPPPTAGSFSLVDHTGRSVTDKDFRGAYLLIYFGYTFCPDVCPTGLQAMSDAIDLLGRQGNAVQPIFVSVDPDRDTAEVMADYVDFFHPRLRGLTGTSEQVAAAAKGYGVRYFKLYYPSFGDDDDQGDDAENTDYAVSHSAFTYLVGPDGRGLATFAHGTWPEDLAREIRRHLDTAS